MCVGVGVFFIYIYFGITGGRTTDRNNKSCQVDLYSPYGTMQPPKPPVQILHLVRKLINEVHHIRDI